MALILELSVPPDDLEFGRVLPLSGDESVQLESVVPIGGEVIPFVRVQNVEIESFETSIREHPRVETVE